jgi:hypothetical protein
LDATPDEEAPRGIGRQNSSITRVRPVISALLERDPTGRSWLGALLGQTESGRRALERLEGDPGDILEDLTVLRTFDEPNFGTLRLAQSFERRIPPSAGLLRWLIEHPDQLTWPAAGRRAFGRETERRRRALMGTDMAARQEIQREALAELETRGSGGSERRWWAFEGFTSVDCWIETDRLVLLVEGKRNEPISRTTDWFPRRNQLVRNLEAACEAAGSEKEPAVLLAVEREIQDPLAGDALQQSAPHLADSQLGRLRAAYLGQLTWRSICDLLELGPYVLPDTVDDPAADVPFARRVTGVA